MTNIYVCMASIPSRVELVHQTVDSILKQLPENGTLCICLNNYDSVPEFMVDPKIKVVRSQDVGDKGDAGKFYWVGLVDGYYLTIDDDMIYPSTYISDIVKAIDQYNKRVVVGFHGIDYPLTNGKPPRQTINYYCMRDVNAGRWVNSLGTGCCGFHTSTLPYLTQLDFKIANMADVWLSLYCLKSRVPMRVLPHKADYFVSYGDVVDECIWKSCKKKRGGFMDTGEISAKLIAEAEWGRPLNEDEVPNSVSREGELQEHFSKIYKANFWSDGGAETVSGGGSTIKQTEIMRRGLQELIKKYDIKSILDAPCGDFNWMKEMDLTGVTYTGIDIVPELIAKNNKRYGSNTIKFICGDATKDALPKADLIICRDMLVHLRYEDINRALYNFSSSACTYLLTTNFRNLEANRDLPPDYSRSWRTINLMKAPFALSEPMDSILEGCTEGNGKYSDKELILFALPIQKKTKLLSVLVPAYKYQDYIEECVSSILSQDIPEEWELEVLVGVDGCKDTLNAINKLAYDTRLRIFYADKNSGAYKMRNALYAKSSGVLVTVVDADDTIIPDTLSNCIAFLEKNTYVDCLCYGTAYTDEKLKIIKRVPECGEVAAIYRRKVIDTLGGWEAWRCGADSEFIERAIVGFEFPYHSLNPFVGKLYRQHDKQLTKTIPFDSSERNKAKIEIQRRRELWTTGKEKPQRIVPQCAEIREILPDKDAVHICMATIPSRVSTLKRVVESILCQLPPKGTLHICLNGYPGIPGFLVDKRIDVVQSKDVGDEGDSGKFYWAGKVKGYYLTADDDIIYPPTYIKNLVNAIDIHSRKYVVGYHGCDFVVYDDSKDMHRLGYPCLGTVKDKRFVHALGTGVSGFHTDTLPKLTQRDFEVPNMTDVWLAKYCQDNKVPLLVLPHKRGYITLLVEANKGCIFDACKLNLGNFMNSRAKQVEVTDSTEWERDFNEDETPMGDKSVNVCMATIPSREDILKESVDSIYKQLPLNGRLYVCLNGYSYVPPYLLGRKKLIVVRSEKVGDRGDAGKFYWLGKVGGYYFSVDDDIAYPRTYIQDMIRAIEEEGRKTVVGHHGIDYPAGLTALTQRITFPCFVDVVAKRYVHGLGTGCMAFHTSLLPKITQSIFRVPNMADIWFAKYCLDNKVPLQVLPHSAKYLSHLGGSNRPGIWKSCFTKTKDFMDTTAIQIKIISENAWKHAAENPKEDPAQAPPRNAREASSQKFAYIRSKGMSSGCIKRVVKK